LLSRPRPGAFHRRPPTTTDCSTPGPEPKIAPDDTNDLYRNDPAPILDPSAGPGPRTRTGERPPPGRGIDAGRAALSSGRPPSRRGRRAGPRSRAAGRAGRKYRTAPRRPRPGRAWRAGGTRRSPAARAARPGPPRPPPEAAPAPRPLRPAPPADPAPACR